MAKRKRTVPRSGGSGIVLDQARHYMRFVRVEEGESAADVARSEGVTARAVEKSIRVVKQQRAIHNQANVNTAMYGMLLANMATADKTLKRMFDAKDYLERRLPDGSTEHVPVDDKTVQLEALKIFGNYVSAMQPKGGGVNVRVQQNNANQANAVSTGQGGYETMLHQIIKEVQQGKLLPSETADVIDAEDFEEEEEEDDEVLTA